MLPKCSRSSVFPEWCKCYCCRIMWSFFLVPQCKATSLQQSLRQWVNVNSSTAYSSNCRCWENDKFKPFGILPDKVFISANYENWANYFFFFFFPSPNSFQVHHCCRTHSTCQTLWSLWVSMSIHSFFVFAFWCRILTSLYKCKNTNKQQQQKKKKKKKKIDRTLQKNVLHCWFIKNISEVETFWMNQWRDRKAVSWSYSSNLKRSTVCHTSLNTCLRCASISQNKMKLFLSYCETLSNIYISLMVYWQLHIFISIQVC